MSEPTKPRRRAKPKGAPRPPAGVIQERPHWEDAWSNLKTHISGRSTAITEMEKLLLTNDSEALNLDPIEPTYPATKLAGALMPQEAPTNGSLYLNTHMDSIYGEDEAKGALTESESDQPMEGERSLAMFALMVSHLERCYAVALQSKTMERSLAIETYRVLVRNGQKLTKGIFKAVTMVYQDMFRVRDHPELGKVLHCMHRIGGFRFNRSINHTNLRFFKDLAPEEGWGPQEMLRRMARRAIHFHNFIK